MEQITKTYKKPKQFQKDAKKMQKQGWMVVSQTGHKEGYHAVKGIALGLIFLPLALFGRGKSSVIVTYGRDNGTTNDLEVSK